MVKKNFLLFIAVILLTGCSHRLSEMSLKKAPYLGDELRIDSYYYSKLSLANDIGVAVFYRDGFCIHTWIRIKNKDTLNYIENEILLNNTYINDLKKRPSHIGAFRIMYPDIEFEVWDYGGDGISGGDAQSMLKVKRSQN